MNVEQVIGSHPLAPHPCGIHFAATDQDTAHTVPHRLLDDGPLQPAAFTGAMAQWIVTHHVSPEAIERARIQREALTRQGLTDPSRSCFPTDDKTQKGNWAEILLAEYIAASCGAQLPVYRLTYDVQLDIAESMLAAELAFLAEKGIHLTAAPEVLPFLIQRGFHPHLGARPLRDVIEKHLRDAVTSAVRGNERFTHAEVVVHGSSLGLASSR